MEIIRADALPRSAEDVDFSFEIDRIVVEPFDAVPLRVEPLSQRHKAYGLDDALFERCDGTDKVLFLASEAGNLAGYITASLGWNGCAMVDDFAVARSFRRRGLASALMDRIADWARDKGLGAISAMALSSAATIDFSIANWVRTRPTRWHSFGILILAPVSRATTAYRTSRRGMKGFARNDIGSCAIPR